jgi:cytochrome P450
MVAAITSVVRTPSPARRCGKASRGGKAIVAFFCQEIPKRRAGQATDLFSELCRATKEDGSLLTDQEVADHMSFLMMAAHDTLTSSVSSLVYLLGKHPEWQDRLRTDAVARSSTRCTSSLRKAGRAGTLRDGLQGSDAHQPAGA